MCLISVCELPETARGAYCSMHAKRWTMFKSRGFNAEQFDYYESIQQCEICGQGERPWLYMDHDHSHCGSTKWCVECVRGVLCPRCNNWMSAVDEPGWLRVAEKYRATHEANKTYVSLPMARKDDPTKRL